MECIEVAVVLAVTVLGHVVGASVVPDCEANRVFGSAQMLCSLPMDRWSAVGLVYQKLFPCWSRVRVLVIQVWECRPPRKPHGLTLQVAGHRRLWSLRVYSAGFLIL